MYAAATTLGPRTTPSRLASTADRLGYDGIVLAPGVANPAIAEASDVEVITATSIQPSDRNHATRAIARERTEADVVCASAGEEEMLRFLAERERLDVLWPDAPLPHTVVKAANTHGIAIGVDLGPVLRSTGPARADAIGERRRRARVLGQLDVPIVISATPPSHLALRAPREVAEIGARCGLEREDVERGLAHWGDIATRTRRARDDRFIEPGVRVLDDDTDDR